MRCEEQQKAEQEAGITEELKRDREGAKAYRRARCEHNGVNYEVEEEQGTAKGEPEGERWGRMTERLQAGAGGEEKEKPSNRKNEKRTYDRKKERGRHHQHHQ